MTQPSISLINLCWNQLDVTKDTVRVALKDPAIAQVILVDNGSTDGSKEHFRSITDPKFTLVDLPENRGSSIGRNEGIKKARGERIFLCDGDILYVKGSAGEYSKVMDAYPDAACVGQHNHQHLEATGHNGVLDISQADIRMGTEYEVEDWFPMAWTQYGLFDGKVLRELLFEEAAPFDGPGYGFEDDILFNEIEKLGRSSLSVTAPTYYHHAHGGWRELGKAGLEDKYKERETYFRAKYGKTWGEKLAEIHVRTRRNNPNAPGA